MSNTTRESAPDARRPLHVLIIAAHYPPINSVAATRPAQWARILQRRGHTVSVLTTKVRGGSLQGCDLSVPPGEVIRVAVPFAKLIRWFDRASRETGDANTKDASSRLSPLSRLVHWTRRVRGAFSSARMPDHHDLWVIAALWRIRRECWDVVISTHGPYACHLIAYRLRRTQRAKRWIADYRDLWVDNHIYPGLFPFTVLERRLEKTFCVTADAITTVSEGLASRLAQRYRRSVEVIPNAVDLDVFRRLDVTPAFPADGRVRLVYTGTVYPHGQSPNLLFDAMAVVREQAPAEFARIKLVFVGKSQANVRDLATRYDMIDMLEQPGQVARDDALRMQRDADALIFFSFCSDHYPGILTSKIFEYLISGTRILSIGARRDESTAQLLEQSGRGLDLESNVANIAAEILQVVKNVSSAPKYVLRSTLEIVDSERSENALHGLLFNDHMEMLQSGR
ncbi:MAG: hypothetical protein CALGDGBN_02654 [Pseudomonadales bacterium]|nr:hypothetical protein [Pseudomonadales bacterium]